MTQERLGSTARGPQHVMMKLQIYNTSPHFGKGIVSIMMLVRQGSSLRAACARWGSPTPRHGGCSRARRPTLASPCWTPRKAASKRRRTLTPQGEELLDRYLAFEKEAREAVFAAFEKHFKADDAFQK